MPSFPFMGLFLMTVEANEDTSIKSKIDKTIRMRYIFTFVPLISGALINLYSELHKDPFVPAGLISYTGPIIFSLGIAHILFWYLQTGFKDRSVLSRQYDPLRNNSNISEHTENYKKLEVEIEKIKAILETGQENGANSFDTNSISDQLLEKITTEAENKLLIKLQKQAEDSNKISSTLEGVNRARIMSISRIDDELTKLKRRASINLTAGVTTATIGIFALASFISPNLLGNLFTSFQSTNLVNPEANPIEPIFHYATRFSLIISIEILAYFFLRLHKTNLEEEKYYQNELTNLESKYAALTTAIQLEQDQTSQKVIAALSETERNHILEKGQSTIEIQKMQIEKKPIY